MTQFFLKLLIIMGLIIAYYKYVKLAIIESSSQIVRYFKVTKYYPVDDVKGVIELSLIALTHVIFCFLLISILPINFKMNSVEISKYPIYFVYGVLLGICSMCVSGLFCKIAILCINSYKEYTSYDLKTWLTVGRGGWIKHHLQSMQILPLYVSVIVLTLQVGSEETIFRSILLNYFGMFGNVIALITALGLFIVMQMFLMNSWQGALFPVIGATVMGLVHSVIYLQEPIIWPLIVAHVTFFLFSIM